MPEPEWPTTATRWPAGIVEAHVEEDLPRFLVAEIHVGESSTLGGPDGSVRRTGAVLDLAVLAEQAEHAVHVEQRLLDLAVHHAEEVERDVELDQQAVHQHQVAEREASSPRRLRPRAASARSPPWR